MDSNLVTTLIAISGILAVYLLVILALCAFVWMHWQRERAAGPIRRSADTHPPSADDRIGDNR